MILAYLDPGAGSLALQALIAGILAVPFFFRTRLSALTSRFRRPRSDNNAGLGAPRE